MANFKEVNKRVRSQFPEINIEVLRGCGYFYYSGEHGESLDSVMAHPITTSTDDVARMAIDDVRSKYGS